MTERDAGWQSRPEAGSLLGLRILAWVANHLGRRILHTVLWPVSLYFLIVRRPERRASRAYLNRVLHRPARLTDVLRHFHCFAKVAADRVYFLGGRADRIPARFVIDPALHELTASGRAGVVLAAHFGSFDAARVLGPRLGGVRLRIVLDKGVNARFMAVLADIEPEFHRLIIDAGQSAVALGLAVGDALRGGDWVGFLADRRRAHDRVLPLNFLGETAWFPQGPFIVASLFRAPLIAVFCRLTDGGYEIHCEVLRQSMDAARGERQTAVAAAMELYVARLESHVEACPIGWFNFFDFWAPPTTTTPDSGTASPTDLDSSRGKRRLTS